MCSLWWWSVSSSLCVILALIGVGHGLSIPKTPCMANCTGVVGGRYQACSGCGAFAVCVLGRLYHASCVGNSVWDDSYKQCRTTSTTCRTSSPPCVKSCRGKTNGNYPSCQGCSHYLTCIHGNAIDGRPCPSGLVFNADIRTCSWTSPYCSA